MVNNTYFYSEYPEEVKIIFEDEKNNVTELHLRQHEIRGVSGYKGNRISVYVYLRGDNGKYKNPCGENSKFKNYYEKRVTKPDRSFIIGVDGRLHLQKYGAALNVREENA